MMSVHDALEAWQAGDIMASRAMRLTGAADIMELYAFAHDCDVAIRTVLLPREEDQADRATALIKQAMQRAAAQTGRAGQGIPAE